MATKARREFEQHLKSANMTAWISKHIQSESEILFLNRTIKRVQYLSLTGGGSCTDNLRGEVFSSSSPLLCFPADVRQVLEDQASQTGSQEPWSLHQQQQDSFHPLRPSKSQPCLDVCTCRRARLYVMTIKRQHPLFNIHASLRNLYVTPGHVHARAPACARARTFAV